MKWIAAGLGLAAGTYAGYVATAYHRFGRLQHLSDQDSDPLLDRFLPAFEARAFHRIEVAAAPDIVLEAANQTPLLHLPLVRLIIRTRELALGATPQERTAPTTLIGEMESLGWGLLAKIPGREIVMGSITQPWEADVVFRALPPNEFAEFREPGYVKIAWTLRAEAATGGGSVFSTQTRALATDATSRERFRRYWALFSPGMILIRWAALGPVKARAEQMAKQRAQTACNPEGERF